MISVACETPNQPGVHHLLEQADGLFDGLYNPDDNHLVGADYLSADNVKFLTARENGALLGIGALVIHDGWGEIKRMFVPKTARGRGVGRLLLGRIEELAREQNLCALKLETGNMQHAALGLYRAAGFVEVAPFSGYKPSDASVFLEKQLR